MDRIIVVGDPQGMYDETIKLLEKCQVTPNDWVIFAGDLVDRGVDSAKCIELAMRREQVQGKPAAVLGNHEEKHLTYLNQEKRTGKLPNFSSPYHAATRAQLQDHHYEYIKKLPLFIRLPEYNAAVVHAGVYPGRTLEEQDPYHLLHIQMIKPFDEQGNPTKDYSTKWPSKIPDKGWKFWTHFWDGPERIIFGHSVTDKPLLTEKACGIDGGACFGHELRAVILPEWEIVSVKSSMNYGKGRRGNDPNTVKMFTIHDDVRTWS